MSRPTVIPRPMSVVVVVGGPKPLLEATRQAALVAASASVQPAELGDVANVVATSRPFAIVMSEEVYATDPSEFEALARDVRAVVIRIAQPYLELTKLERTLLPKLGRAFRRPR